MTGRGHRKQLHARRRFVGWRWVRAGIAAFLPAAVGLYATRKRTGLPPTVTLPVVSLTPLAVAAVMPPGRWRYIAAGAAYMWVFKVTWELPAENPEKLASACASTIRSGSTPSSGAGSRRLFDCSVRCALLRE